MEWERQRRDQLMSEKQKQQSMVDESKAENSKLKLELEALVSFKTSQIIMLSVKNVSWVWSETFSLLQDNKKRDMGGQIQEAKRSVATVTSQIDNMRQNRDEKLAQIESIDRQTLVICLDLPSNYRHSLHVATGMWK